MAAVPPQCLAPDYVVLAISDENCAIVAVEFRRWFEQRLAHHRARAAPNEGQMPPPPPPPKSPPRPGGRPPTARELELDNWTAYVAEGEAAADDEKDYLGILDSACSRTCHGDAWGNRFRAWLDGLGIEYAVVPVLIVVCGIGGRAHCDKAYRWPCGIFGRPGEIMSIEIPDSPTPLLLSRQTQKTLGTVLDFDQATVSMKTLGVHGQAVLRAHGGHFAIRITDVPPEGHPGLVEEWECQLANTGAKKN